MPKRQRSVDKAASPLARMRAEGSAVALRRFIADAQAYCDLIENHRRTGKKRFRQDCAILLGRLFVGALQLPEGELDSDISERRRRVYDATHIDVAALIFRMVQKTHRRGPTPKPWSPIARKWRHAESRNLKRLAPEVRQDPLFDTVIPFEVWEEQYESLRKYLGDLDQHWIVFDPYGPKEAIGSSLADGLADIWRDLKSGLLVYAKGSKKARQHAIDMWRSHHSHWSHHLVLALNPLNTAVLEDRPV